MEIEDQSSSLSSSSTSIEYSIIKMVLFLFDNNNTTMSNNNNNNNKNHQRRRSPSRNNNNNNDNKNENDNDNNCKQRTTTKLRRVFYYIVLFCFIYITFSIIVSWTMVLNNNGRDMSTTINRPTSSRSRLSNNNNNDNDWWKLYNNNNNNNYNRFQQNLIPIHHLMTLINNNTHTHKDDMISWNHDFGNIRFTYREDLESPIIINPDDYNFQEERRSNIIHIMDAHIMKHVDHMPPSERKDHEQESKQQCQSQIWTTKSYPNCNQIHELLIERPIPTPEDDDYENYDVAEQFLLQDYEISYLSSGYYRDAWRMLRKMPFTSSSKRSSSSSSSSSSSNLRAGGTTTTTNGATNNEKDINDVVPVEDHFVLKKMKFHDRRTKYNSHDFSKIHKEALIMERLSDSNKILDIYGYCGISVQVEAMAGDLWKKIIMQDYSYPEPILQTMVSNYTAQHKTLRIRKSHGKIAQEILNDLQKQNNYTTSSSSVVGTARKNNGNPLRQNNFTPSEILQISLDMAESLEDLHTNHGDGPIIHSDVHIEQWLIGMDGTTKLNDFGDADIMKHNMTTTNGNNNNNNAWCEVTTGKHSGVYRSPEEFILSAKEDQFKDVYSLANNVYTLLTGLWPFYDGDFKGLVHVDMQENIILGERPYIDPKFRYSTSNIERKLVELMELCWKHRKNERPPGHDVVKFLREVKLNAIQTGELQPSNIVNIPMEIVP